MKLKKIKYKDLNPKQKENYNFQKISAILADYGYSTIRLTDDWQGADFIAQHYKTKLFIKVQLKGRLTFQKKYLKKDIYICFRDKKNVDSWYLFNHDKFLKELKQKNKKVIKGTLSWDIKGGYSFSGLSSKNREIIKKYRIPS
jgi:hypothetical protein